MVYTLQLGLIRLGVCKVRAFVSVNLSYLTKVHDGLPKRERFVFVSKFLQDHGLDRELGEFLKGHFLKGIS